MRSPDQVVATAGGVEAVFRQWSYPWTTGAPVASVAVFEQDSRSPASQYTVARLQATVVLTIGGDGRTVVHGRCPGVVDAASPAAVQIEIGLRPWYRPLLDDVVVQVAARSSSLADQFRETGHIGAVRRAVLGVVPEVQPHPVVPTVLRAARSGDRRQVAAAVAAAGWSPRTARRRVAASLGMSPDEVRRLYRASRARAWMLDGAPLAEVAVGCGYADQSHLNREFTRWCGYTPASWARHVREWEVATAPGRSVQD